MSYPVKWLDETFSSRSRAETLLRPDLESGLITEHDYNLATTFLPGYHRYWPYTYGSTASLGTASYGRFYRTPPWGQLYRARAHFQFTQSLDNPQGFAQSLQNVNVRMGGDKPLPWTLPQAKEIPRPTVDSRDIHGDTARPDEADSVWAPDVTQSVPPMVSGSSDAAPQPQPSKTTPRSASRWEQIRTANAAGAKPSTWDILRQRHERNAAGNAAQPTNIASDLNQKDCERVEEQARFDAMLEAERKIARG